MARRNVYQTNYERMVNLGLISKCGKAEEALTLTSSGYMDLVCEIIPDDMNVPESIMSDSYTIGLAHYYNSNGDRIADPEVQIVVNPTAKTAIAICFEMPACGIYRPAFVGNGKYNQVLFNDHNSFLRTWLNNLKDQGFSYIHKAA